MDTAQEVHNLKLSLAYSAFYEKFTYKFYSRLDKLTSLVILLAAIFIATGLNYPIVFSFIIAIAAFIKITSLSESKSEVAGAKYRDYITLFICLDDKNINAIKRRYRRVQLNDSMEIDGLAHPARLAALSTLGMTPEKGYTEERNLSIKERLILLFIGERIEYNFPKKYQIISSETLVVGKLKKE